MRACLPLAGVEADESLGNVTAKTIAGGSFSRIFARLLLGMEPAARLIEHGAVCIGHGRSYVDQPHQSSLTRSLDVLRSFVGRGWRSGKPCVDARAAYSCPFHVLR